jgi:hypothetical protein
MFNQAQKKWRKRRQKQAGSSVILVLLFLMVLSAAGMGMMFSSNIDTLVNANYKQSIEAYYASKAGLEEARDRIRLGAAAAAGGVGGPSAITPPGIMPTANLAGGVVYILNPDNNGAVLPWIPANPYFDDELCHENFAGLAIPGGPFTPNVPCKNSPPGPGPYYTQFNSVDPNTATAAALPYKWVRVTAKQSGSTFPWCPDGACVPGKLGWQVCADSSGNELLINPGILSCQSVNMMPVYTITSLAMTATGARRITQEEIANISVPPIPGALTLDGPNPTISTPNSAGYGINGNNANSCNQVPPAANLPAIGTVSGADATTVANSFPAARDGNYVGADGTTPDVTNVSSKLGEWGTVGGLQQIVTDLTEVADVNYPTQALSAPPWGSSAAPLITVINGDYNGTCNGFGILVITGALTCNGNYSWTGAILVIGKGYVQALNGGGGGQITGGIFVANLYDHQCAGADASCNAQHILPNNSIPGSPYFNWNGGGGNGLNYDACAMRIVDNKIGFHVLVTREEMY